LPKRSFKKFKKAIIAIIWGELEESSDIQDITWKKLMEQKVLPETLEMSFDEFSSLQPENFVALLNTNKAKRN
jgi:hypothetical protein